MEERILWNIARSNKPPYIKQSEVITSRNQEGAVFKEQAFLDRKFESLEDSSLFLDFYI